jgi:phenylpyruvate tautomerase PptA (4-oxalocrotonate tautomerase family)
VTIITVNTAKGRLSLEQRRELAETLTDAVLVPEVGQFAPAARPGFQVHFVERERDMMAIGGRLLADSGPELDVMVIEGSWGSSGGVLSILPLLQSGAFTEERVKAVRAALDA